MATDLNPAQREAVETLSGPLLVLAGAGTGKTRVVTYRIARLIRHGVPAERILAVTFTNKAAAEMQQRALALLRRPRRATRPEISTFHSLCVRILRRHASRIGLPTGFAIYDTADQLGLARAALREIRVPGEMMRPRDLLMAISDWKCRAIRPAQAVREATSDREHLAASAYRRYQKVLEAQAAVDFDDLLLRTCDLFDTSPPARRAEAERFDHILIDEYQDTNRPQYLIVKALAEGHRNLCVVGDDDQSIYGWRGAEVAHILRFQHDWPGAKVVRLEENYRSTEPILALANELIRFNRVRHDKLLRATRSGGPPPEFLAYPDEQVEAEQTVSDIRRHLEEGAAAGDFAILFRTNQQPRALESELRRQNVPYVLLGGQSFFDRREVRDLLAYLRAIATPRDDTAIARILNTPPRGIGEQTRKRLLDLAVRRREPLWEVLREAGSLEGLSASASRAVGEFRGLIERMSRRFERGSLASGLRELIDSIGYEQELSRLYHEPNERAARWAAVEELVNAAAQYETRAERPSLRGLLDEVTLGEGDDRRDKDSQLNRNAVALLTLHAAKGLEFPHVYLVGLEEGILPHARSIELDGAHIDEERRLCYVGITRAQHRLVISRARTRRKWGKVRDTVPSRFLFEMRGEAERAERAAESWSQQRAAADAAALATRGKHGRSGRGNAASSRGGRRRGAGKSSGSSGRS